MNFILLCKSADVGLFLDAFQNLFFSLQYSFDPITATIVDAVPLM